MSKVVVHHRAVKYLKKRSEDEKEKIKNTLRKLENYPNKISGIKSMKGEMGRISPHANRWFEGYFLV